MGNDNELKRMTAAKNNVAKLIEMVEYFMAKTGGKKEFVDMKSNIEMANRLTGPMTIIQYTSEYFLMFKDDIMAMKIDYLLNYDYAKLIKADTANETEILIRSLIGGIKQIWTGGDFDTQTKIKNYILMLLKFSIVYDTATKAR